MALNGDERAYAAIDRIVDRLADEVHRVDIPEPDLLQESAWYGTARPTLRKVIMTAVAKPPRVANATRGPHLKIVEVPDTASALIAGKLAQAPLAILVEDRESDGALLDILVEELGWPELQSLWMQSRRVTPRAIEVVTAGGKDAIPQRVERAVSDASEEGRPHRLFVLCDSDIRWPGDQNQSIVRASRAVRETCEKHGVPHHIWRKRCGEDYLPDEMFEAARDDPNNLRDAERFDALLRRSRLQRDHFPIKGGLRLAERSEAVQAGLYTVAEQSDLTLLERPLFPSRPRLLVRVRSELRAWVTAGGLRARDGEGELDVLLHTIAQEL